MVSEPGQAMAECATALPSREQGCAVSLPGASPSGDSPWDPVESICFLSRSSHLQMERTSSQIHSCDNYKMS